MPPASVKVAVFYDWQNAYNRAREAFGWENMPNEYGNFSPYQLGRILAAGNGRGNAGLLVRVEVHRGLPSQRFDPRSYAANRRQSAAWMKENREVVVPRLRSLRYPPDYPDSPAVEKGIDVNLALTAVEWTLLSKCDVVIIFSHDSDLLPVPETIARLAEPSRVETASWKSPTFHRRLRTRLPIYNHEVTREVFTRVETRVNFAHRTQ